MNKPYFAKFLESQLSKEEQAKVAGGNNGNGKKITTTKWPHDNADNGNGGNGGNNDDENSTMKYPSDDADNGGGETE